MSSKTEPEGSLSYANGPDMARGSSSRRLKALPRVEVDGATKDPCALDAEMLLTQLEELRHRILQAYPQSEPRALQQPSLPGALNVSPSQQTYSDYQPQTKLDERLIRDMVREEVRRQLSTVSAASSEHAHQDAAVEHDGKNRHHNASHGALMNVPAHQHAPHRHLRRTNTNGVNTGAGLDGAYEGAGSSRSRKLRARSSPRATGEAAGTEAELSFPSKRGRVILHRSCSPPGFHNGDDGRGNERGGAGGEEEVTPLVSITDTSKELERIVERGESDDLSPLALHASHERNPSHQHHAIMFNGMNGPESLPKLHDTHAHTETRTDALAPDNEFRTNSRSEDGDHHDDDGEWVKVSGNAFGAFIHVALQSGVSSAAIKTGPMVIASLLIQGIFSEELISQHIHAVQMPLDARIAEQICWVPVKLQISALMIFITLMFHNIPGMMNALRLAFFSTHHKGGDGEFVGNLGTENINHDTDSKLPLKASLKVRIVIFVLAVLSEIVSWFAILLAGILFAFTSPSVDLVIRSTVSVMFVLNIDEIVFEACCPASVKDDVEETEYRLPSISGWMTPKIEHYVSHYYGVYVHLNILLIISTFIIFLLRIHYLGCEHHPLWQGDHVKGLAAWPGGLPDATFPH